MRRYVVPAALISAVLLTGCSSGSDDSAAQVTPSATHEAAQADAAAPSTPSPSTTPVPVLKVGQTGTYGVGEADDAGAYKVTSTMSVTVVSAKYVTPAELGTSNKPAGQYVEVTLTFKNVGKAAARVETYGNLKWEDSSTAAQDVTTLEGVGSGASVDAEYKPGQSVTGKLVLDVARKGGTLTYTYTEDPDAEAVFKVALPAT
jgi:hypothetical protein